MFIKYYTFPKDYKKFESIQGGKMEHIFNFSKVGNNNLYSQDNFTSEEAKEAFYKGKWTVKFHGSNGFITKENNQVKLWERRDLQNKDITTVKEEYLELSHFENNNNYKKAILPNRYNSNSKNHHYIFVKIDQNSKKGKDLYPKAIELLSNFDTFYQSIEYVGQKVQGNSNQFNWNSFNKKKNYGIVFHSCIEIFIPDVNYDKIIELSKLVAIEGWVIYHLGKAWKIRTNMVVPPDECAYQSKIDLNIKPIAY